jgi:hypothetical protein
MRAWCVRCTNLKIFHNFIKFSNFSKDVQNLKNLKFSKKIQNFHKILALAVI